MKNYEVLDKLNHDQKDYEAGSSIELDDETAAPLSRVGVIKPAESEKAADAEKPAAKPAKKAA